MGEIKKSTALRPLMVGRASSLSIRRMTGNPAFLRGRHHQLISFFATILENRSAIERPYFSQRRYPRKSFSFFSALSAFSAVRDYPLFQISYSRSSGIHRTQMLRYCREQPISSRATLRIYTKAGSSLWLPELPAQAGAACKSLKSPL